MKYRLTTQMAEALLENEGVAAYLYVLEKLNVGNAPEFLNASNAQDFWRQVLVELDKLDKLEGENNASTKLQQPQQQIK